MSNKKAAMSRSRHNPPYWDKPKKPGEHKWWKKQMNHLVRRTDKTETPVIKNVAKGNTPGHF
ncbi:MAG: hypothetical protein ACJ8BW_08300 [Ktedonobacteraceae bacterium]